MTVEGAAAASRIAALRVTGDSRIVTLAKTFRYLLFIGISLNSTEVGHIDEIQMLVHLIQHGKKAELQLHLEPHESGNDRAIRSHASSCHDRTLAATDCPALLELEKCLRRGSTLTHGSRPESRLESENSLTSSYISYDWTTAGNCSNRLRET